QGFGDRRAVDCDKGPAGPPAREMNGLGESFLTRARRPLDEQRDIRVRDPTSVARVAKHAGIFARELLQRERLECHLYRRCDGPVAMVSRCCDTSIRPLRGRISTYFLIGRQQRTRAATPQSTRRSIRVTNLYQIHIQTEQPAMRSPARTRCSASFERKSRARPCNARAGPTLALEGCAAH